jgi:hypothetical protein
MQDAVDYGREYILWMLSTWGFDTVICLDVWFTYQFLGANTSLKAAYILMIRDKNNIISFECSTSMDPSCSRYYPQAARPKLKSYVPGPAASGTSYP